MTMHKLFHGATNRLKQSGERLCGGAAPRGPWTGPVIDHLDSTSCFGLYFSIHSSRLKSLGMRKK